MIDQTLNRISILGLVACDASYYRPGDFEVNVTKLGSYPDNSAEDEYSFPIYLAERTGESFTPAEWTIPGKQKTVNTVSFPDWTLVLRIDDEQTGFGCAVFNKDDTTEFIVALTGSNGLDPQDWYTNISLATTQWTPENRSRLTDFLTQIPSVGGESPQITFAGQSLGGALAQYAAYDYAVARSNEFDPSAISLVTYNGLGGADGLAELYPNFQRSLLGEVTTAHYVVSNDLVHRLGGGNVNAQGNTFRLDFRDPFKEAPFNYLNPVAAHRIESGFYFGFEAKRLSAPYQEWDFRQAVSTVAEPINGANARKIAFGFGNLFNNSDHGWAESALRLTAALIVGVRDTPSQDLDKLLIPLFDAMQKSRAWGDSPVTYQALRDFYSPFAKAIATSATSVAGNTLLLAIALDAIRNGPQNDFGISEWIEFMRTLLARMLPAATPPLVRETFGADFFANKSSNDVLFASEAGLAFLGKRFESFLDKFSIDPAAVVTNIFESPQWTRDVLSYVTQQAKAVHQSVPEALTAFASGLYGIARTASASASGVDFRSAVRESLRATVIGILKSASNAYGDFTAPYADALFSWGESISFGTFRKLTNDLSGAVRALPSDSRKLFDGALDVLTQAGQATEIVPFTARNAFGNFNFDPYAAPNPTSEIKEGQARFYTVYLPYGAGEGGQRLRLKLEGIANDTFSVMGEVGTTMLTQSGEFELTIPEGQRQIVFALHQEHDVDSESLLTLSSTLVDSEGIATHQTHVEATLTLHPVEEPADPAPTNLIEAESADAREFFDTAGSDRISLHDAPGATNNDYVNYDATAFHANQFGGRSLGNNDWVSTNAGRDVIYTADGNDLIETGIGGVAGPDAGGDAVHAGPGDDRIYGNEVVDTDLAIAEGESGTGSTERGDALSGGVGNDLAIGTADQDLLSGGGGADVLIGGAGNDYLLGDTDYETRLFDWTVSVEGAGTDDRSYSFFGFKDVEVIAVGDGDRLYGGAGDDVAFGEAGDDLIDLGAGSDHGIGGDGDDVILGGSGDDLLIGNEGGDFLDGGEDTDRLFGAEGSDALYGGAGDDFLQGDSDDAGAGEDYLDGEDGNDVLVAGGRDDVLYGGAGDDELHGDGANVDLALQGADELFGEEGNDILVGYAGDDMLDGGEGDDTLAGGAGEDDISGGAGNDVVWGDDAAGEDGGDADLIEGGEGDDQILAQGGDDVVFADEGSDFVDAGTGADYVDGGEGDDFLAGGTGDDELVGGEGDDWLSGGLGADSYRYSFGDGVDRIAESGDAGPGVIDTLSFGGGVGLADVTLSRDYFGNLAIRFADGGEVDIGGMYSDPWARIERITFEDGTVLGAAELDALPIGLIFGTDGDDVLLGSDNIDTLVAQGGADVLDGGRGDDVLEGGAGVDTYNLGFTSGHDTIVEAAGETSVVVLAAGLGLGDVRAAANGDDLTLTVRGTGNAVTMQDYFSAPQEITVRDAAGTTLSAAQLLEISGSEQVTRETLKADYRVRTKVNFFAQHFVEGYEFVNSNTAARTSTSPVSIGVDRVETFNAVNISYFDGRPGTGFTTHEETVDLRPGSPGFVLREALQYVHQLTESDEPFISPGVQDGVTESSSEQSVQLDWHENPDILLSHTQRFETQIVTDPTAPPGQQAIGIASITHNDFFFSHVAVGNIVITGDAPPPPSAYLPASEVVDRVDRIVTQTINEVRAGPGDNNIGGAYIADGGAGNDTISGDGLLLGGDGDDTLFGTGSLYGEDGNDSISGTGYLDGGRGDDWISAQGFEGSVIVPGSGDDVVEGGGRNDVVRIGADDTGSKLLWDNGSVADFRDESGIPFFRGYYESLGITNWLSLPRSELPTVSADDYQLLAPMFGFDFWPTDRVELPAAATLASLDVGWGFADLAGVHLTLDVSWDTSASVRIVLPNPSQTTGRDFSDNPVGNGFEYVRLGDGTLLRMDQLLALAPATLPRRQVVGTEFDDSLLGWEHDDDLEGLAGNDQLIGNGGADSFRGGPGWDSEIGGTGDDRYRYFLGDDIDGINDAGGSDAIVFGEGIAPEDVLVTRDPYGTLYLEVGNPQNRLELYNWFTSEGRIERVEFASGMAWDAAEIESRITTAPATEFADILNGGDGDDLIDALAGDDTVYGNGGNDILYGGEGNDYLEGNQGSNLLRGGAGDDNLAAGSEPGHHLFIGGAGDDFVTTGAAGDVVAFNAGDGNDSIFPVDAFTLSLGGSIDADDLALSYGDFGLVLSTAGGDSIRLLSQPQVTLQLFGSVHTYDFSAVINEFYARWSEEPGLVLALGDVLPAYQTGSSETEALGGAIAWQYGTAGSTEGLTSAQIQSVLADPAFGVGAQPIVLAGETNHAPIAGAIADQTADEDADFGFNIAGSFSDPDAGDVLRYAAITVEGGSLPQWLSLDENTGFFSGTPGNADVGSIGIRVAASDAAGLSAFSDFALTVLNVNDAPVVAHAMADQSFATGAAFTFALPADTFADEDADDALSLSARLFGGGALPAWLTFNPATGAFSGAPQVSNIGVLHLAVTATDGAGEAAVADFGLVVRAPDGATVSGRKGDDAIYGGGGNETLVAKGGNDYVFGDAGDDVLRGGAGNDVLQGGEGNDELRSGSGQNLLDGGVGDDVLYGGQGSAFLAGGAGNDEIRVGRGTDVIAFNAGDGIDTLFGGRDGGNTLSFGGGIGYDDLSLSKSGHDLVVSAGANDKLVLKNWYRGNQSVQNLQVIIDATAEYDPASSDSLYNQRVQVFDMWSLVARFNQALAANPHLDSWSIMNGIADVPSSGSSDSAIGGDLAYWYGRNRTLAGIGVAAAQELLGVPGFGADAQSLRPFSGLQEGFVRLS